MTLEDEIIDNARRLRDDARLLFDARRYASCGLLQVVCLEELGKAYLVANKIPRDPKQYHRQKQEAAISLSAAVRMHHLLENTCGEHGWDYWGNMEDAEKYYEWMSSAEGRRAIEEATKKVSSWLRVTRHGVLENQTDSCLYRRWAKCHGAEQGSFTPTRCLTRSLQRARLNL